MTRVRDGLRRRLVVLACGGFGADSGLAALPGVEEEVALVVEAFAALGYDCPPDHRIRDETAAVAVERVAALLAAMGPNDVAALYVTGHGEVVGAGAAGSLVIHAAESRAGRKVGSVSVGALLEGLHEREAGERLRNLLLMLDVCHAGTGVEAAVREVRAALPAWLEEPGTATGVSVVAAARADNPARVSVFARNWRDAVLAVDVAPRSQPYLHLPTLVDRVQAGMNTQVVETVALHRRGAEVCLPNPRHHLDGVDPDVLAEVWEPAARALPERRGWAGEAAPWLFTGRGRVNVHLARWLAGREPEPVVVLTGAPGSGKSTILARLVVLTVPDLRAELAIHGMAVAGKEALPDGFSFAATISASRMSTETLFVAVAAALGLADRSELQDLADAPASGVTPVILVDALDEAEDPHDAVVEVLRLLTQAARAGALRLIVATRERPVGYDPADPRARRGDLISPLIGDGEPIRVDSPQWLESGDIARYCERVLSVGRNDAGRANPYALAARKRRILARAIEERARHSFLLAAIVARRHTLDTVCVDPDGPVWREQFPERIGDAMRDELRALHGHREAARQLALLRPLALADGSGLSRDVVDGADLWAALATALGGDRFDGGDVTGLLAQRSATHLVSEVDAGVAVLYRFHHEALAEALRPTGPTELAAAHAAITSALLDTLDNAESWAGASPYVRRALPFHARLAGRLADLAGQAGFLAHCDPDRLNAAFAVSDEARAQVVGTLLRPYVHRLRDLDTTGRAFLLGLAARVVGEDVLADHLFGLAGLGVEVLAVRARPEPQRQVVADGRAVEALVATRNRAGAPLLFLGNGRYVDVREPDSGMLVDSMLASWPEITGMLAVTDDDGFPVVVAGGTDGAAIFDATTRALRASVAGAFYRGIAVSPPGSAELLVVGWTEARVDLWRPGGNPTLETLPVEWEPGRQPVTCAAVLRSAEGDLLVAVAAGGVVTLWDATDGGIVDMVEPADVVNLQLAALCPPEGEDTLLVTTGLSYRTAMVWQPSTGARAWALGEVPVCAVSWTGAHGSFLALGYLDGSVRLWRPDPPEALETVGEMSFTLQDVVVGPAGAAAPLIVAIDRIGAAKSWTLPDLAPGPGVSARQPHSLDIGELRTGRPYLAIGGNRGADVWRLDAVDSAPRGLHGGDALRVARIDAPTPLVLTAGDDGAVRVWHERDGRATTLAVPTGGVNDMVCWTEGDTAVLAVTAVHLLLVFDASTGTLRSEHQIPAGPNRMAHLLTEAGAAVASAARTRLYLLDPTDPKPWWFDLPMCYPGTREERTTTARSITALAWVDAADTELVVATGGGMALALRFGERTVEEVRGLAEGMGVILTAHVVAEPGQPPLVVLGSIDGQLSVVDVVSGAVVHDLTKDDARIAGATTVRTASGRSVLVTTHCDRDVRRVTGLRVWDLTTGVQQHGIIRPGGPGDPYLGPPHPGRTADGIPFVGYLVDDGVEVTLLDENPRRIHLPLSVTANDLCVSGDVLYVAGGGGYVAVRVTGE